MTGLEIVVDVAIVVAAAALAFWVTRGRRTRGVIAGVVVVVAAAWFFTQTDERDLIVMLAIGCGLGIGIVAGSLPVLGARSEPRFRRISAALVALAVVGTLVVGAWIGTNSPTETWMGPIISHGDRNRPFVALTFDDGPNVHETLVVAHILDSFHVKGTFFTVGKALAKRPDISRALLADGQLLGDHSYHHDQWRWLDPRYPELERTQSAFRSLLNVCPTFYRPPHGEHTPFMSYQLARKHMKMIGWDDSAADWATTNGRTVARRILEKVKPGSIIVLHDGLDGDLTANRSVLTVALPLILQGLQARGLHAVRLDQLLGISGYGTNHC